jgi:hypothetical protein
VGVGDEDNEKQWELPYREEEEQRESSVVWTCRGRGKTSVHLWKCNGSSDKERVLDDSN